MCAAKAVTKGQSWPAKRNERKKNAYAFTDSPSARRRRKVLTQVMRLSQHNEIVTASRTG